MQASEVASALNIHHQHIIPNWIPDHTPIHNQQLQKLTLAIQKTIHSGQTSNEEESPHPQTPPMPQSNLPSSSNSDNLLLEYTLAAMKISEPSKLLTLATHTLYTSCGFERVLLAFAVPGKEKLEAKICYGAESDAIQAAFHCPLNKGNFWYYLLQQYHPIQFLSLIIEENKTKETPVDFLQLWRNFPGLVGSLYTPNKPIGLILADRGFGGEPLEDIAFAAFSLILSQANGNLARLA
jgi:hypothetical protein